MDLAGIKDGTSNTVGIAEAAIGDASTENMIRGGLAQGLSVGASPANYTLKNDFCWGRRGNGGQFAAGTTPISSSDLYNESSRTGHRWHDSHPQYTQFFALLPPNAPSCIGTNPAGTVGGTGTTSNSNFLISASSYHSGGVNICMMDGAVRFISDTIEHGDPTAIPPVIGGTSPHAYTGASIYGVWGALGSRAGGESTTL
jgi:prepilin-type processing-associated H-X9-DG protein